MEARSSGMETIEVYDRIAEEFGKVRRKPWPSIRELRGRKGLALDLGCGSGRNAAALSAFGYSHVVAADLSIGMLKSLRRRGLKEVSLVRCDLLRLPLVDCSFDAVAFVAVIHHISGKVNRFRAMAEVFRVTKPGGRMLVTAWSLLQTRFLKKGGSIISRLIRGGELGDLVVPWGSKGGRFYHLFTKRALEEVVRRAGFRIIKSYGERIRSRLPENWVVVAEKA
ncbi:MAG: class I SAM-dependent methyltransferase [Candidatus Verstraetearchaeota archaeon]|nr:class I SAM-dependent methyltransferase [Candidatus Verstraetearchaeota archaeon]